MDGEAQELTNDVTDEAKNNRCCHQPQKHCALSDKRNLPSSEMGASQDTIKEDVNEEEPGQRDTMAWAPMCSNDMST